MSMWVITEEGEFFSEVTSKDGTHRVVRSRDKRSAVNLENFINELRLSEGITELVEVQQGGGTDYEFRINCEFEEWQAFMTHRMETGTGTNHKNAVSAALGGKGRGFLRAMMDTWSIWYGYQEQELRLEGSK